MAKILFVLTGVDYWTLADGTRHPTGFWAVKVRYGATPGGVVPTVDSASLAPEVNGGPDGAAAVTAALAELAVLKEPLKLEDVDLADYAAVFYPGGHGPMEDLWQDADSGRLLSAALASGRPLAVVCHAPVAMLATRSGGASPFAGYRVTAYTNDEEAAVGLADRARWLVEDELVAMGVEFTRGEIWKPYTVVDRNLFTGQNPASAAPLAGELLKTLG